jgi:hypothetical protein
LIHRWERFLEATDSGQELEERTLSLCLWLEMHHLGHSLTEDTVYLSEDLKILYVYGVLYNVTRWLKAARIYITHYKFRNEYLTSETLIKLGVRKGRPDQVKKILDQLPCELRNHIVDCGRLGRIYQIDIQAFLY